MATLPSAYPSLSIHLSDSTLTPLLSSASTTVPSSQSDAFSTLTTSALSVYTSAARLSLGLPQRIILETRNGPVVLHSFLKPQPQPQPQPQPHALLSRTQVGDNPHSALVEETRGGLRPLSASTEATEAGMEAGGSEASGEDGLEMPGNGRNVINGIVKGKDVEAEELEEDEDGALSVSLAPLLIGTVVAPGKESMGEAKRAGAGLERIGTRFQREWVKKQEAAREIGRDGEEEDG